LGGHKESAQHFVAVLEWGLIDGAMPIVSLGQLLLGAIGLIMRVGKDDRLPVWSETSRDLASQTAPRSEWDHRFSRSHGHRFTRRTAP
jgi:hypothetical protein